MGNAFRYATRVTVVTSAGARHSRETLYRPGSAEAPLTAAQLEDKFDRLAAYAVSREAAERIKAAIRTLDELPSVDTTIGELRA
jgi:2-methylcitrate dehydratase PrpD